MNWASASGKIIARAAASALGLAVSVIAASHPHLRKPSPTHRPGDLACVGHSVHRAAGLTPIPHPRGGKAKHARTPPAEHLPRLNTLMSASQPLPATGSPTKGVTTPESSPDRLEP